MQSTFNNQQGINELTNKIKKLQENPRIRKMVEDRMNDFRMVQKSDSFRWYEEMVYCLLTAFSSALMGQKCIDELYSENRLFEATEDEIRGCLKEAGHRFPNKRAEYIRNTQHLAPTIKQTISEFEDSHEARIWLVKNIKGFGWKEASHYLRNIGFFDLAIIDRHIINNLREHKIIELDPKKGLTKKRYLAIEKVLHIIAKELDISVGELDLYLWYRKTGKVLK
jgi:N-glycosylase/DNA lyase